MGNCWPAPNIEEPNAMDQVEEPDANAPPMEVLQTTQFLQRILIRIASGGGFVAKKVQLRKIINRHDLDTTLTPLSRTYVQIDSEFLADTKSNGAHLTNILAEYIIGILFEKDYVLSLLSWRQLFENILYAKTLGCARTKLLQLCFLTHVTQMPPVQMSATIKFSRYIEVANIENIEIITNRINAFCEAARRNPEVDRMTGPEFVQPLIIPFRINDDLKGWPVRSFVLDGNFIAVTEFILRNYDEEGDPCGAMLANNTCFHESIHAANRQHYNSFRIHTPQQPGLIPQDFRVNETNPLEAGYAAELALWGGIPDWNDPCFRVDAEEFIRNVVFAKYAEDDPLILSEDEKDLLIDIVGVDFTLIPCGGMVASLKRVFV